MAEFSKVFDEIVLAENYKILLQNTKIHKIDYYKKNKKINIYLISEKFLKRIYINEVEESIKDYFNLDQVNIIINFQCEDVNLIIDQYIENIKYYLVDRYPEVSGFLTGCTSRFKKNCIYMNIEFGGEEVLRKNNCEKIIKNLISYELSKDIGFKFVSNKTHSNEEYIKSKQKHEKKVIDNILKDSVIPIKKAKDKEKNTNLNSDIILGKPIKNNFQPVPISEVTGETGVAVLEGEIFDLDFKEIKGGKYILTFAFTDYTSSIMGKRFLEKKQLDSIKNQIKKGICVKVRGDVHYDKYDREIIITAYDIIKAIKKERIDNAEEKRVELHVHTKMSSMDGMADVGDLVNQAAKWGHKAIAITDHGVVQSFPNAYYASKKAGIKIIYGVECYFVNDNVPIVKGNSKGMPLDGEYIVFDIETTGLNSKKDRITEIGAVKIKNNQIVDTFNSLVNPQVKIPEKITKLTGITDEMVEDAPLINQVLKDFLDFSIGSVLVAHNASFDVGFIKENSKREGMEFNYCILDTLQLSREMFTHIKSHKLNVVAEFLKVRLDNHHRAYDDAKATAEIFIKCLELLKDKGINSVDAINTIASGNNDIKKLPYYHAVILVKNYIGLKNLYELISKSHLDFFYKKPRISKSLYMQYSDGLMIGSACEAGELYKAFLEGKTFSEIDKIARFYDYLEIQPLKNNEFLVRDEKVKSFNELKQINKKIVQLAKKQGKPVVATCDVHFLNPHDEVYRRILMGGQGFSDADNQAPLYFRTTEEMLEEFSYLGKKTAYEVVIKNTNLIADMIEDIRPVPEEKCPPKMENAENDIKEMSVKKAESIYGSPLPEIVKERMDKELNSIIKNGFSVMYIIAQKLVTKSLSDGYLVGSRGSVGSSFVAFLCDITEVNALPPHYICKSCKYSEFIVDGSYGCGADMPEQKCPNCGEVLFRDGHEIPFETFLGFDGDKEPDIDLNFSGDYQPVAHKYTEELFGKSHVFRAGTIGTIAEKTAFGFVKNYFDDREKVINNAEINRLVKGCSGVKRTTGQHPGGIIIVPRENEIFEFCPVQRPADDVKSDIITTHFDYHSIDQNLLKLDILGHDDPTMIKMLEDLSGINAQKIPLWDKDTMSIFTSTKALGIEPDDINSEVGTFAVPEFGTKFVRQMLVDTKPTTFAELVRISGLSHGTDVWLNNAQELVRSNTATLPEVICTRDDIMVYLMLKGVPPKQAFVIMEKVRKGKGVTEEEEQIMKDNKVPKWYIESCKKIKYMFPKAHAVAYVTMAFRIAYFKVHYPMEFYIAYFTVRADDFDAEIMTNGRQKVINKIDEIERKIKENNGRGVSQKEKNMLTILEVCNEMYSRGISFLTVDLYKSDAVKFLKTDEGILPPLNSLQGVGTNAAKSIAKNRKDGEFISIDDFRIRTKSTKTVIEILENNGVLKDMPETNQLSLF